MKPREVVLYVAVTAAMVVFALFREGGPFLGALRNDSYQYLSVAENLRREGSAATSIVHFDIERAHGQVPAPVTTFPPGYPALIWLLSWTGLPAEWLGVLISFASTVALVLLLRHAGQVLGFTPLGERLTMLVWAFSAQAAFRGSQVMTESLFTALSTAAIALLLPRPHDEGRNSRVLLASVVTGIGCWVRYAGLFFVVAFNLYALSRILRERSRRWVWLACVVLCDSIVGAGFVRNMISGEWHGGHHRRTVQHVWSTAGDLVLTDAEAVLGSLTRRPMFLLFASLFVIGGVATAAVWVGRIRFRPLPGVLRSGLALLLLWLTTYTAAMFYAGLATHLSFRPRLFFPALPLLILLLGIAATAAVRDRGSPAGWIPLRGIAFVMFVVGYVGANVDALAHATRVAPHEAVVRALDLPMADGRALSEWIEANVSPRAVLVATNGQATGYVLKRNTISLVSRSFSETSWEADEIQRVMMRFGASFLVIYRESSSAHVGAPPNPVMADPQFLRRLAANDPPSWLELAASNAGALIYRLRR